MNGCPRCGEPMGRTTTLRAGEHMCVNCGHANAARLPAIAVGWRPGDPDRDAAWKYVQRHYEPLGWPIHTADSGQKPFSRSASRNAAADHPWDVLALLDADCLLDLDDLRAGVDLAYSQGGIVLPHGRYVPLSRAQTTKLLTGAWTPRKNALYLPRHAPGGVVIVRRDAWRALGGYDADRWTGWGGEDSDLLTRAYRAGLTVTRTTGTLLHLWHPSENPLTRAQQERTGELAW